MKKITKWFITFALTLMALGMYSGITQAAVPSLNKYTNGYYWTEMSVSGTKKQSTYHVYSEIKVKNMTTDAEIQKVKFKNTDLDWEIGEDTDHTQYLILSYDGTKDIKHPHMQVSFTVRAGGRNYTLTTKIIFLKYPLQLKTFTVGSKSFLTKFAKGVKGTTMHLRNHPTITYTPVAGYANAGIRVKRGNQTLSYTSGVKLQKGDLILLRYYNKTTRKIYSYQIYNY